MFCGSGNGIVRYFVIDVVSYISPSDNVVRYTVLQGFRAGAVPKHAGSETLPVSNAFKDIHYTVKHLIESSFT